MPSPTPTFSSPAPPLLAALQHLAACSEIAGDQSRLLVQKVVDATAACPGLAPLDADAAVDAATAAALPPEACFADVGGVPLESVDGDAAAADAWGGRAAACIRAAVAVAAALPEQAPVAEAVESSANSNTVAPAPRPSLGDLWNVSGQRQNGGAGAGAAVPAPPRRPVIQIIGEDDDNIGDVPEDAAATPAAAATAAARADALAAERARSGALLLCALYDAASLPALPAAWATGEAAAAAAAGLGALAAGGAPARRALAALHPVLVQQHFPGLDAAKMTPYQGPSVFRRALAARQLAWLAARLAAADAITPALPCLLAAADDPAPAVQAAGALALEIVALTAPRGALVPHAGALAAAARSAVVGADAAAWPRRAAAAVALVVALDGAIGPPTHCDALLDDWLLEGLRHAHDADRSTAWAAATPPLLTRLGASVLRGYARLMPLLLEWVAGEEEGLRRAAAVCVAAALRAAWPRARAHAAVVWRALEARGDVEDAVVDAATVLWAAAGAGEWRDSVEKAGGALAAAAAAAVAAATH